MHHSCSLHTLINWLTKQTPRHTNDMSIRGNNNLLVFPYTLFFMNESLVAAMLCISLHHQTSNTARYHARSFLHPMMPPLTLASSSQQHTGRARLSNHWERACLAIHPSLRRTPSPAKPTIIHKLCQLRDNQALSKKHTLF